MPDDPDGRSHQQLRRHQDYGQRHAHQGRAETRSIRQRREDNRQDCAQLSKLRDECLNGEIFYCGTEATIVVEQWRNITIRSDRAHS